MQNYTSSKTHPSFSSFKIIMPEKIEEKYYVHPLYIEPRHKKSVDSYPSIKTIYSLQAFFNYLENNVNFFKKILVAFDVDEVLLHRRKTNYVSCKSNLYVTKKTTIPGTNESINKLAKYADVICLTARSENKGINLKQYNIDLLNSYNEITLTCNQEKELIKFGYSYKNNTIYTNMLEKGTALQNFYSFSSTKYDKVIFIDDNINNCLSVMYTLHDNNIDIESFHLIQPEYNQHCFINIEGYSLKKQSNFYETNKTKASRCFKDKATKYEHENDKYDNEGDLLPDLT